MKTISLVDIKDKLGIYYEDCHLLESYGIDTSSIKSEISNLDLLCDTFSDDNNMLVHENVQVKGDFKDVYNRFIALENEVTKTKNALHIFESIKKVNPKIQREELNPILEEVLNDLINYASSPLEISEFDTLSDKLYELIKLEFKYNGFSHVLNFMRTSSLDETRINELFFLDYKKHYSKDVSNTLLNRMILKDYSLYDKALLIISVTESGYLDYIKEELDTHRNQFETNSINTSFFNDKVKEQDKTNRKNILNRLYLQRTALPALLSLTILVTANVFSSSKIDESTTDYQTTTEVYDTINGSYTETSYDKLSIGDTTIKIYNPIHENGARVIKTYTFNDEEFEVSDYDTLDYENMDFTSSEYKYDEDANNVSTDSYTVAKKVTDVNYDNEQIHFIRRVFYYALLSLPIFLVDSIFNHIFENRYNDRYYYRNKKVYYKTLIGLIFGLNDYIKYIKNQINEIDKNYKYMSTKGSKKQLKEMNSKLNELNKKYEYAFEKYQYLEEILKEYGYNKTLKRGKNEL